jgi:hypothetical protein
MQRTKLHIGKNEHGVLELPEDMRGSELKHWARQHKMPILKRKMKRRKFPKHVMVKNERKLRLVSRCIKGCEEMKRTKFPS